MKGSDWLEFLTLIGLLCIFVVALFGVFNFRQNLVPSPVVVINSPSDVVTATDRYQISGVAKQNVSSLKVNGETVEPDREGNFTVEVPLNEGDNIFKVTATNIGIKNFSQELKVVREPSSGQVAGANSGINEGSPQATQVTPTSGAGNIFVPIGLALLITLFFVNFNLFRLKKQLL